MRRLGLAAATLLLLLPLESCSIGNNGAALARHSCNYVVTGLADYEQELAAPTATQRSEDEFDALSEFRQALPLASQAALSDGQWQALMTTLQDVNRIPIANLVTALDVDCTDALGHSVGGAS